MSWIKALKTTCAIFGMFAWLCLGAYLTFPDNYIMGIGEFLWFFITILLFMKYGGNTFQVDKKMKI